MEPSDDQKNTEVRSQTTMRKTTIKNDIVERDSNLRGLMRFIDKTNIEIDRELSDLDRLALDLSQSLRNIHPM